MINQNEYNFLKKISCSYEPADLVNQLDFDQALRKAWYMLNDKQWDEDLQKYATQVLEEIKKKHSSRWDSNWRYDAILGYAYDIILEYDKRYNAYKSAFQKVNSPPPELLIALAGCCNAPGEPVMSTETAIFFVKEATKDIPYTEGLILLRGLYRYLDDFEKANYYDNILKNSSKKIKLPSFYRPCCVIALKRI